MNTHAKLLRQLANELPRLARQAASEDAAVRTAGALRLRELGDMLAPFLAAPQANRASRRSVLRGAGVFVAWAIKRDD